MRETGWSGLVLPRQSLADSISRRNDSRLWSEIGAVFASRPLLDAVRQKSFSTPSGKSSQKVAMPKGGSKPGERRGGRKKGTRNKKTRPDTAESGRGLLLRKLPEARSAEEAIQTTVAGGR
jgi:hypothetical protein